MDYEPLPIISQDFSKVVVPLIDDTVNSIDIIVYHWRFYRGSLSNPVTDFNDAIIRAVNRGVRVRCLVQDANAVNRLRAMGCEARKLNTKRLLHCKLLILDKNHVVMGSHNYTQHAFSSNYEASIYFILKDLNNALVQYFDNLFNL